MAAKRVFLAGASGAIGASLVPQLVQAGYMVFGITRRKHKASWLRAWGAQPLVLDVFDRDAVVRAMAETRPEVVINQLTDLPKQLAGTLSTRDLEANAHLREQGSRNLIEAARTAGARRVIAQSLAWLYAPGQPPYAEDHPLDLEIEKADAMTVHGVVALETMTLKSPPLEGIVLRYGQLYGPGTWNTAQKGPVPIHVDAAAFAALLAVDTPHLGVYNIAEEKGLILAEKARRELGWNAAFRLQRRAA
jgi:nucleoside-diphosphate-sugar epimerase